MNPSTNTNQELYKSFGINANINPYTLQPYSTQPSGVPVDITAKSMQKVAPITLPQTSNNSPADTIISDINLETQAQINKAAAEQKALELAVGNKAKTEQNAVTKAVESIFGKKADVLANQPALEEQAGIKAQREAQQLYTGQLAQLNNDYRAEVDRIKKQGGSEEQMRISLGTAYNNYAPKIIDINTLNNAAIANIKGIQDDADRKTALLTAPLDNQLTYFRDYAQKNVDNLTAKENKQLEAIQANLTQQKKDIQTLEAEKAKVIAEIANNGGGTDKNLVSSLQGAKNMTELYSLAANSGYVGKLDRLAKEAQLSNIYSQINERRNKDINSGTLTEAQLKNIDTSPQGKKLKALTDLKVVQDRYKNLVTTYGFQVAGEEKSLIDKAYADLKIAYKEAANLGALTGPDVGLIEEAVKPASGALNLFTYVTSGGAQGIVKSLDDANNKAKQEALTNYKNLTLRNTEYGQSDYVKSFIDPYATDIEAFTKDNLKSLPKGEIIRTPEGAYLESLGGGNFSQL